MNINQMRVGMLVECQQGVGRILAVDREADTVLLQGGSSEEQWAVHLDEIESNPQCHDGCDRYY